MAKEETNIVNTIMRDMSPLGTILWRNVRGQFYTKDGVLRLISAIRSGKAENIRAAIKMLRLISAGLQAPGASDLVGGTRITITPEMVGQKIMVLTVIEVKTATGTISPAQRDFVSFVTETGGFAGFARCSEDARKICKK